ncbi:hypothetical protein IWQ60_007651 [Tieghemiomyces parasiticus]|uniref:Uncharacterized protein n=1 Tax=Tieghemiomyces parasiticus TaxID=78921 RepID=A0A9W8DU35_9FUNG|nr:hypothetical protein IWQ60_007651 [Tieghemiomyces parasiticus]
MMRPQYKPDYTILDAYRRCLAILNWLQELKPRLSTDHGDRSRETSKPRNPPGINLGRTPQPLPLPPSNDTADMFWLDGLVELNRTEVVIEFRQNLDILETWLDSHAYLFGPDVVHPAADYPVGRSPGSPVSSDPLFPASDGQYRSPSVCPTSPLYQLLQDTDQLFALVLVPPYCDMIGHPKQLAGRAASVLSVIRPIIVHGFHRDPIPEMSPVVIPSTPPRSLPRGIEVITISSDEDEEMVDVEGVAVLDDYGLPDFSDTDDSDVSVVCIELHQLENDIDPGLTAGTGKLLAL